VGWSGDWGQKYNAINQTVFRIEVACRAGRLARVYKPHNAAEGFSESVHPGARGRKVIDPTRDLKKELYK